MNTRDRVYQHVVDTCYLSDPSELTDDLSLIDTGIVDSTGMLDIILFVETEFDISVSDRETTPANFETIGRIAAYVDRKIQEAAA